MITSWYVPLWCMATQRGTHLHSFIGITDYTNEQAEDHVDEERDEGVQVNLAEYPSSIAPLLHFFECHEHVIAIQQ